MANAGLRDALAGLLAVVAPAFVGCGGPGGVGDVPGDEDAVRPQVALVMKSLANEFFETMAKAPVRTTRLTRTSTT